MKGCALGRLDAGRRRPARRVRQRRRGFGPGRGDREPALGRSARHVQSGLHGLASAASTRRRRAWRSTSAVAITASCSPPTTCCRRSTVGSTCSTSRSATRRRCRRCCSREYARRDGHGRAHRRRRRRGVRRVRQLREARARGAHHPGARRAWVAVAESAAPTSATHRPRPHPQGDDRAASAPLRDDPEHLRCAVARRVFHAERSPLPLTRASPIRPRSFYDECDSPSYLDHLLDIDARLWLPDDLLAKVDRATMAFSLEARVPYLDHDFYGWCARLDPTLKVSKAASARCS